MFTYLITYLKSVAGLGVFTRLTGLAQNRTGVTAIEYGLIAGLIAVAIIAAVTLVATNLNLVFGAINTKMAAAAS